MLSAFSQPQQHHFLINRTAPGRTKCYTDRNSTFRPQFCSWSSLLPLLTTPSPRRDLQLVRTIKTAWISPNGARHTCKVDIVCASICLRSSAAGQREKWGSQQAVAGTASHQVSILYPPHPQPAQHSGVATSGRNNRGAALQICPVHKEEGTCHHIPHTHRTQNQGAALATGAETGQAFLTRSWRTPQMRQLNSTEQSNYSGVHGLLCFFFFFLLPLV